MFLLKNYPTYNFIKFDIHERSFFKQLKKSRKKIDIHICAQKLQETWTFIYETKLQSRIL